MTGYIAGRLAQMVIVILGVTFVTFALMYLSGDPVLVFTGENWTQKEIEDFRREMGLDKPWIVQYVNYIFRAAQGDFGDSLRQRQPVLSLIIDRLPATLMLTSVALLISIIVPFPLGFISAINRGRWPDMMSMLFAVSGQSVPGFWLGIMLILVFGVKLRILPISGTGSALHLVLPAITLSTYSVARNARLVRSSLLEVIAEDYVRTARSKGLRERTVLWRHAFRNSLLAVTSVIGLELGYLLGGAVIVETIFAWPGLGRLTIQAINGKDIFLVQGAVIFMAIIFVIVNLGVDLLYTVLDPRIRYR